jgi:Protein of unknown function (DUF3807)
MSFRAKPPDDDSLGYYQDGVNRTLTDEQVAIFRHMEIQELLNNRASKAQFDIEEMMPNGRSEVELCADAVSEPHTPAMKFLAYEQ